MLAHNLLTKRVLQHRLALAVLGVAALLAAVLVAPAVFGVIPAQGQTTDAWPDPPQNVQVAPGPARLTITWDAPDSWRDHPAHHYQIDIASGTYIDADTPPASATDRLWVQVGNVSVTASRTFTATGTYYVGDPREFTVTDGLKYFVRIRAVSRDADNTEYPSRWVIVSGTAGTPPPLTFGTITIPAKTYTAGAEVPKQDEPDESALALPEATGGSGDHRTYTATGLPAGLSLSKFRIIHGTPEDATNAPVTVTYTVSDRSGTASITFQVSVAPPVVFDAEEDAEEDAAFGGHPPFFEYTIGQAARINETLPSASGGHGGLTYHLTYLDDGHVERTVNDDAPGFSFDSATRVLTSDTGGSAPSATAFYSLGYSAIDKNGAVASLLLRLAVRAAPTLPEIADQSLTVGEAASITLPEAVGGALPRGAVSMDYTLSPEEVDGLTFSVTGDRLLSGTPVVPGSTEMTYTVTDANGVTATRTFTITVVNGPSAPTAAPSSLRGGQNGSGPRGVALWNAVTGATGYVVQLIAADGSYPDKPVNTVPANVALTVYPTYATFVTLGAGDYKMRVAAKNDDGVGPWSSEVSFTVNLGGM